MISAHKKGLTLIKYDTDNDCIITGGSDGLINIWSEPDKVKQLSFKAAAPVLSLAYEKERVFVSSKCNKIEVFSTVTEIPGIIYSQFLSNINYIFINKEASLLAACSDDFTIKILNLSMKSNPKLSKETEIKVHKAPVLSVSINSRSTLLASAGCDGFVYLINIDNQSVQNKWRLLEEKKDISQVENLCRVKFSTTDYKLLSIPLMGKVEFYHCGTGNISFLLKFGEISKGYIQESAFSYDGSYYLAGTSDGWILIWSLATRKIVHKHQIPKKAAITDILWHPIKDNVIYYSDINGNWTDMKVDLNTDEMDKDELDEDQFNDLFEGVQEGDKIELEAIVDKEVPNEDEDDVDIEFDEEEDESTGNDIDLSLIKKQYQSEDDAEEENEVTDGMLSSYGAKPQIINVEHTPHKVVRPGSAPRVQNIELLLWSSLVVMKKHFDDDDTLNTEARTISGFLEINFQDKSISNTLIIRHEICEYHLASANRNAIMLINNTRLDNTTTNQHEKYQAQVVVRPLNANWTEWSRKLPVKDSPIGCALLGDKYGLILCDNGKLRWMSLGCGGMEMFVESIPGTPVCMISDNYYRFIVVIDEGSCLRYRVQSIDINKPLFHCGSRHTLQTTQWNLLPISPQSTLTWIGFSEDSTNIYAVDSKNQVHKLNGPHFSRNQSSNPTWIPVLDLKIALPKGQRYIDRYFPIGVNDDLSESPIVNTNYGMMCVLCKGTKTPRLVPLPHLTIVPFKVTGISAAMPSTSTLDSNGATIDKSDALQNQLEEQLLYNQMAFDWTGASAANSNNAITLLVQQKKLLFQMFAMWITQNEDSRAYSIAEMMPDSQLIQLAIQFAAKSKKKKLAEKLGQLALKYDEQTLQNQQENKENSRLQDMHCQEQQPENDDRDRDCDDINHNDESSTHFDMPAESEAKDSANTTAESIIKFTDGDYQTKQIHHNKPSVINPFASKKVDLNRSLSRRGSSAIDKLVKPCAKSTETSETHDSKDLKFGYFNIPSNQKTFKIKRKRKSSLPKDSQNNEGPMSKFTRNI